MSVLKSNGRYVVVGRPASDHCHVEGGDQNITVPTCESKHSPATRPAPCTYQEEPLDDHSLHSRVELPLHQHAG